MSAFGRSPLRRLALRCLGLALALLVALPARALHDVPPSPDRRPRVAVLGDSDSHGFQDRVSFPLGGGARGGQWQPITLQWTEILAQHRSAWLDFGPRERLGVDPRVAQVSGLLGRPQRAPHKEDHRYNFAVSGALCEDIHEGRWRQSQHLATLIEASPEAWRDALVVIRIGINELGVQATLDGLARDPDAPQWTRMLDQCVRSVERAVVSLRDVQPRLRFVLVGVYNNAHWVNYHGRWHDRKQLANIDRGLDRFDHALRAMAERDPAIAFFDDRALFERLMGGRDAQGRPAYRALPIVPGLTLTNTRGNAPNHFTLADGHNGTVWNALWANELLALLQARFGIAVPPLPPTEISHLVGH